MFARWGRFVYRRRRIVALLSVLLALAAVPLAAQVSGELSSGGWVDRDAESSQVTERLAAEFDAGRSSLIALYRGEAGEDARSADFQGRVAQSLERLRADADVKRIVDFASTGDARFISADSTAAYALIELNATEEESVELLDEMEPLFVEVPGLQMQLTGYGPLTRDATEQSERDLQRAETVSLPLALIILIAVFASLLAAGLPLLVAGLAIPSTLGIVYLVAQQTEMSIYVLNVATMLGLALAIDYSLFLVSRFREELHRGRSVEQAVERAVATSGKAVAFSGLAVAIGLSGLLFFKASGLSSMGIGGSIVVLCSVFFALTFLPAALGMLGHRVDALSLAGLGRRLRGRPPPVIDTTRAALSREAHGPWGRVAHWVMAHPIAVLVPVLAFLLLAGTPFLRLQQGVPGAEVFPPGLESRDAYVALQEEFSAGETTPLTVLVDVQGEPTSPDNVRVLSDYAARLQALEGVDLVQSPFSNLSDPITGAPLTVDQTVALWTSPPPGAEANLTALRDFYIRGSTVRFDALSPYEPAQPDATGLVPLVRAVDPGAGNAAQVGGVAAAGYDFLASMRERTPWAIGVTLLASAVVLFLLFGSIVLPIKAVFMTLLSITASFGALVWIFQEGNLSNLLDFEPLGYTVAGNPVIMFSVLFGLSMDYEVLLLSRVQEAYRRTGDNRASVAEGLSRTAGVITGAALIMVSVFAAFALADIITIKSIGVGMAIAVFLDATIIRVLLVPATMRLMGRWNWWAPGPLGRLAERLGFSHVEEEDEASDVVPAPPAGQAATA